MNSWYLFLLLLLLLLLLWRCRTGASSVCNQTQLPGTNHSEGIHQWIPSFTT